MLTIHHRNRYHGRPRVWKPQSQRKTTACLNAASLRGIINAPTYACAAAYVTKLYIAIRLCSHLHKMIGNTHMLARHALQVGWMETCTCACVHAYAYTYVCALAHAFISRDNSRESAPLLHISSSRSFSYLRARTDVSGHRTEIAVLKETTRDEMKRARVRMHCLIVWKMQCSC